MGDRLPTIRGFGGTAGAVHSDGGGAVQVDEGGDDVAVKWCDIGAASGPGREDGGGFPSLAGLPVSIGLGFFCGRL